MVSCMARLSRFVTVAVLLGGATVSLSACTGGSDPIASPSPSVSTVVTPSPSVSPSPTPLTDDEVLALIPEDARAENFVSATNFARFFLDRYPELFDAKPETALFRSLSAPSCGFCSKALSDSDGTVSVGAHNEGGRFVWPNQSVRGGIQDDGFWYVTQGFSVSDTSTYLADGTLHKTEQGGAGEVGVKLSFGEEGWRVDGVEFVYDDE
jgi:hypothetical protein